MKILSPGIYKMNNSISSAILLYVIPAKVVETGVTMLMSIPVDTSLREKVRPFGYIMSSMSLDDGKLEHQADMSVDDIISKVFKGERHSQLTLPNIDGILDVISVVSRVLYGNVFIKFGLPSAKEDYHLVAIDKDRNVLVIKNDDNACLVIPSDPAEAWNHIEGTGLNISSTRFAYAPDGCDPRFVEFYKYRGLKPITSLSGFGYLLEQGALGDPDDLNVILVLSEYMEEVRSTPVLSKKGGAALGLIFK